MGYGWGWRSGSIEDGAVESVFNERLRHSLNSTGIFMLKNSLKVALVMLRRALRKALRNALRNALYNLLRIT